MGGSVLLGSAAMEGLFQGVRLKLGDEETREEQLEWHMKGHEVGEECGPVWFRAQRMREGEVGRGQRLESYPV